MAYYPSSMLFATRLPCSQFLPLLIDPLPPLPSPARSPAVPLLSARHGLQLSALPSPLGLLPRLRRPLSPNVDPIKRLSVVSVHSAVVWHMERPCMASLSSSSGVATVQYWKKEGQAGSHNSLVMPFCFTFYEIAVTTCKLLDLGA